MASGEMESRSNNSSVVKKSDNGMVETEEAEALKKRISSHPLYGLLVQTHVDCLTVGSIGEYGNVEKPKKLPRQMPNSSYLSQPELDRFMEAYCFSLSKLKEEMEEPQQETVAFINSMHLQLEELTRNHCKPTEQYSITSSGDEMINAKWSKE